MGECIISPKMLRVGSECIEFFVAQQGGLKFNTGWQVRFSPVTFFKISKYLSLIRML